MIHAPRPVLGCDCPPGSPKHPTYCLCLRRWPCLKKEDR